MCNGPSIWYQRRSSLTWLNIWQAVQTSNCISFRSNYHIGPSKRMSIVGSTNGWNPIKISNKLLGFDHLPLYHITRLEGWNPFNLPRYFILSREEKQNQNHLRNWMQAGEWRHSPVGSTCWLPHGCWYWSFLGDSTFAPHTPTYKYPNNSFRFFNLLSILACTGWGCGPN